MKHTSRLLHILCLTLALCQGLQASISFPQRRYQFTQVLNQGTKQQAIQKFDSLYPINEAPAKKERSEVAQLFLAKYYPQLKGLQLELDETLNELVKHIALMQSGSSTVVIDKDSAAYKAMIQKVVASMRTKPASNSVDEIERSLDQFLREYQSLLTGCKIPPPPSTSTPGGTGTTTGGSSSTPTGGTSTTPTGNTGGTSSSGNTGSNGTPNGPPAPPPPTTGIPLPPPPPGLGIPTIMKKVSFLERKIKQYSNLQQGFKRDTQIKVDETAYQNCGILDSTIRRKLPILKKQPSTQQRQELIAYLEHFQLQYEQLTATLKSSNYKDVNTQLEAAGKALQVQTDEFIRRAKAIADKNTNGHIEDELSAIDKEIAAKISFATIEGILNDFRTQQKAKQQTAEQQMNQMLSDLYKETGLPGDLHISKHTGAISERIEANIGQQHDSGTPQDSGSTGKDNTAEAQRQARIEQERKTAIQPIAVKEYVGGSNPFYIRQFVHYFKALMSSPEDDGEAIIGFLKEESQADYGIFSRIMASKEKPAITPDQKLELWILAPLVEDYKTDIYMEAKLGKRIVDKARQLSGDDDYPKVKIVSEKIVTGQKALYLFASKPKDYKGNESSKQSIEYIYGKLTPRWAIKQKGGLGLIF